MPPEHRLNYLYEWIPHIKSLGANAIYFGPPFESSSHGYDTKDYFQIDRRLGTNDTFKELVKELKQHGIQIILDVVFNHVGRDFGAFQDVLINGKQSQYVDWFININFEESSPYGDKFSYEGWAGHYDLVKLNLHNQAVCQYLFEAISFWVDTFDIDDCDWMQPMPFHSIFSRF
ncbi:MAG: alpha-amylase family glycosyl hydrolase [Bacteroidota bacterium]